MGIEIRRPVSPVKLAREYPKEFGSEFVDQVDKSFKSSSSKWPKDSGKSGRSFKAKSDNKGNVTVTNSTDYAGYVEFGKKSKHKGTAKRMIDKALEKTVGRMSRG